MASETTERDELARLVERAIYDAASILGDVRASQVADAILAAGWRRQVWRPIETEAGIAEQD